jgi:hypothetical protein
MPRFNPFRKVDGRYGAPMGRHGSNIDQLFGDEKLIATHCGGDGYYDRGGAYWGHSDVWAVVIRGERGPARFCAYVESKCPDLPDSVKAAIRDAKKRESYRRSLGRN